MANLDLDVHLQPIAQGDAHSFAQWMANAEPGLRSSLRTFAAVVDVEAVLQESLLRVWQLAGRVTPDGRPNALLRMALRIARNLAVSEARRMRQTPIDQAELEIADGDPECTAPDPMLRAALAECYDQLAGKPALVLGERLDSAGAEPDRLIAERMGMKLNTYLQNITRARKMLADCLETKGIKIGEEA